MKSKIFKAILITAVASLFCAFIPLFICIYFRLQGNAAAILILFAVALPIICAATLARLYSGRIVKPITDIDLDSPDANKSYDEISNLIHKLRRQNSLIDRQMSDLRRRQEEFNTIASNMSEGFILLDNKSEILSYNKAALMLLGSENVRDGQHFISLNRSPAFVSAVNEATQGRHGESIFSIGHKVYQLLANPVVIDEIVNGVVIVILDITEKQKREEMRKEFTSNVSHELKTPLTSISGISEMLAGGMISPEDIPKFSRTIQDEAGRLLVLINDIIKLSKLDESALPPDERSVDLLDMAQGVAHRLAIIAEENEVSITVSGEETFISSNPSVLEEMLYNLVDNAIKYNKKGGRVNITVSASPAALTVADTGIGIPTEHLDRIFERFYRVDKSHSKEIGGTGLGLSIVKHSAEYLGATLTVDSTVDVGTSVTVLFPGNI